MSNIELERESLENYREVEKWLVGKTEGTKNNYLSALKAFIEYMKLNPKQLIDLAEADRKKSIRNQGEVETKVKGFFEWLTTKYIQKSRGVVKKRRVKKRRAIGKRGLSRNLASMYTNAMRGFFKSNGFQLNIKLPKASSKKENFKTMIRPPDVKKLLDVASNIRDRAIILALFQSGMSISDLCNLNYGDIEKELNENRVPLHIHLIRKKELVEYDTFLGQEAVETLKLYLEERKRKGEILRYATPLFTKRYIKSTSKIHRINSGLIEATMKTLALKSGLVSKERMAASDINPCRPHALRSSFMSILKTNGMNNTAVEYLAGHTLPTTEQAYWQVRTEELRKMYKKYMKHISLSPQLDTEKLEILEYESKKKEDVISALIENGKHKEQRITQLTTQLDKVSEVLGNLESDLDIIKMERIVNYVISKAPSNTQLKEYLSGRKISENILERVELDCLVCNGKTWHYTPELDAYKMA